jgi:hypothetical protein
MLVSAWLQCFVVKKLLSKASVLAWMDLVMVKSIGFSMAAMDCGQKHWVAIANFANLV